MILSNESIAKIEWSLDSSLPTRSLRSWSFKSSGGNDVQLARIVDDGPSQIFTKLYDVSIEKPATLVLKNVNGSYNGTYKFTLTLTDTSTSEVAVFIAGKFHLKLRSFLRLLNFFLRTYMTI